MLLKARIAANRLGKRSPQSRVSVVTKPSLLVKSSKRSFTDHYATLGVSSTADASEIKKAFFEKAKKVHPDVNKGDPNAQNKFVELSAAYGVLKDKNKRAQYDAERQYGSSPFGSSSSSSSGPYSSGSSYGQGGQSYSRSQQTGYNPYRQSGGNPYYQTSSHQQSGEDFMKWYQSQYGDVFRDFDEFNRGNTTIIEERMPDGSIRVRIVRSNEGPRRSRQQPAGDYQQQQQQRAQASAMFNSIFGSGPARTLFSNLFGGAGFDPFGGANGGNGDTTGSQGIPFGSGYLDQPLVRISELHGQLSFSVTTGRHVGTMAHKILNNNQGDVLTCNSGSGVLAKARHYMRDGKERMLIESGDSKRLATIEAVFQVPEVIAQAAMEQSAVAIWASIKNRVSLHYQVLDESDRPSGYMSVSPFRRTINFYDMRGQLSARAKRDDIEQENLQNPTRDDWTVSISDTRLVDSSVYIFATAFSTLKSRSENSLLGDGGVLRRALSNFFKRG